MSCFNNVVWLIFDTVFFLFHDFLNDRVVITSSMFILLISTWGIAHWIHLPHTCSTTLFSSFWFPPYLINKVLCVMTSNRMLSSDPNFFIWLVLVTTSCLCRRFFSLFISQRSTWLDFNGATIIGWKFVMVSLSIVSSSWWGSSLSKSCVVVVELCCGCWSGFLLAVCCSPTVDGRGWSVVGCCIGWW